MDEKALARWEFRRQIEEIRTARGKATELISLYVPPTRQISDAMNYLRAEYSQSSNIKSKSTMKNVTAAIESIMNRLKVYRKPPPNGVVFFVGHKSIGGDKTEMVAFVIEPPEPFTPFLYRCDSNFFLEPLEAMLEEKEEYGLVVIDRSEATVGFLKGKHIEVVRYVQSLVPSKHGRGGQSQRRFERLIEIAAHEFYTKIGDLMTSAFLERKNLKGILIGGPGPTKEFFVGQDYIHHELKKKIVDVFDVGYTNEAGLRELMEKAGTRLGELELVKEKKIMDKFTAEVIKRDGGLAAYGMGEVMNAMNLGAVGLLLVSEGLRKEMVVLDCPAGHSEHIVMDELKPMKCPKCGATTTAKSEGDLVKYLTKMAGRYDTNVELISTDTDQGAMLMKAFGGIAAILRYKVR